MRTGLGLAAALMLGSSGLVASGIALADVKAGADAWSRGDYPAAVREWQGPAERGDPDAEFNLGQAYRLGRGVPRDLVRAESLFGKAAAQGHVQAADNYGLLMFDRGDRAGAMPYVRTAAERGDPRAQYLLGIAHFNGDLAPKDWVRAYALMSLARASGLPQAGPALAQMDQHIPLAQRQAAASLATQLGQQAETRRAAQLASADLDSPGPVAPAAPLATARTRPATPSPQAAVPAAVRMAEGSTAATAGADYARPAAPVGKPAPVAVAVAPKVESHPAPKPVAVAVAKPAAPAAKPAAAPKPASGPWRVQLGAFGVATNADALWARVRSRPELAGHPRLNVPAGKVIKLQAGGFATRDAASAACAALGKAGLACVPAQD